MHDNINSEANNKVFLKSIPKAPRKNPMDCRGTENLLVRGVVEGELRAGDEG